MGFKLNRPTEGNDKWTWQALVTEAIGAFALCYVGGMSVQMHDRNWLNQTGVALAHMFVLTFFIWSGASTSGANYNGAVTLALCVSGHMGWLKGVYYMLSGLFGAFLGGGLVKIMSQGWTKDLGSSLTKDPFLSRAGYPHPSDRWSLSSEFFAEFFATAFLTWMVYMCVVHPKKPEGSVYAITIGGVVGFSILSIGNITGAAVNPWRFVGPALATGELFQSDIMKKLFIYLFGTMLGGVFSSFLYMSMYMASWDSGKNTEEAENDEQKVKLLNKES